MAEQNFEGVPDQVIIDRFFESNFGSEFGRELMHRAISRCGRDPDEFGALPVYKDGVAVTDDDGRKIPVIEYLPHASEGTLFGVLGFITLDQNGEDFAANKAAMDRALITYTTSVT
jgi:hypothetical protein